MKEPSPKGLLPDDALVDRAREGNPEAMDELVKRHHASVFRVALGILRDEDAAADVAQDSFLKAFKGLGGFRGDAAFRTWLLTITANEERAQWLLEQNVIIITALVPVIGYDKSAEVAKKAFAEGRGVREVALEMGALPEDELNAALDLRPMTEGGVVG